MAHRDPVDRVAAFLSMLNDAQGEDGRADTIELPMRSRDVAEYVGLSTEAVRAALVTLRREGAIEQSPDRSIHIADRRQFNGRVAGG
jgi:CRP-like cAMP-binding protein